MLIGVIPLRSSMSKAEDICAFKECVRGGVAAYSSTGRARLLPALLDNALLWQVPIFAILGRYFRIILSKPDLIDNGQEVTMEAEKINANPIIHQTAQSTGSVYDASDPWNTDFLTESDELSDIGHLNATLDAARSENIDSEEIFQLLKDINDPEHPLTLEQLAVVSKAQISIDDKDSEATILFTPTIPHCSMSTLIGLCLRVRLIRALPPRFKVDVRVREGTHQQEAAINKQLNDKERVAAALENNHLIDVVQQCLSSATAR